MPEGEGVVRDAPHQREFVPPARLESSPISVKDILGILSTGDRFRWFRRVFSGGKRGKDGERSQLLDRRLLADDYSKLRREVSRQMAYSRFTDHDKDLLSQQNSADFGDPDIDRETMVTQLSEAVEFTLYGESVRVYNFCGELLTDDHWIQIANALGKVADKSGGKLAKKLSQIVIMPDGHPFSIRNKEDMTHGHKMHRMSDIDNMHIVTLNKSFLDNSEKPDYSNFVLPPLAMRDFEGKRSSNTNYRAGKARDEALRAIADKLPNFVSGDLESGLIHEFHHVLDNLSDFSFRDDCFDETPPSRYAAESKGEEELLPEVGVAILGGFDELISSQTRQAYEKYMKSLGGKRGFSKITARQLDLRQLVSLGITPGVI